MSNSAQAQNAEAEAASTYVEPESLFAQCTAAIGTRANVRLLRWDFLDDRARRLALATTDAERAALALPRRQDLERDHPAAFYSLDELQALPRGNKAFAGGPLPLVAVSYCWRSAAHPDPFGQALVRFAAAVRHAQRHRAQRHNALLPKAVAVFFDWCSLDQKDAQGNRTDQERASFQGALASMQLWYAHQLTTVFMMTDPATDPASDTLVDSLSYGARGWPTFESRCAMLGKRTSQHAWPLLVDVAALGCDAGRTEAGLAPRYPPLRPDEFHALLATKRFTNGADAELVANLYTATAREVIGGASMLKFGGLQWGDAELVELCAWLPHCQKLRTLSLVGNRIGDGGIRALAAVAASGGLQQMRDLNIGSNVISDRGGRALLKAIEAGHFPAMTKLETHGNRDLSELMRTRLREALRALDRERAARARVRTSSGIN